MAGHRSQGNQGGQIARSGRIPRKSPCLQGRQLRGQGSPESFLSLSIA